MSNDRKGKASFSLYKDMRPLVEALPDDSMLKAIYRFVCDGIEPEPFGDQISELTWSMFREKLQYSKSHEIEISKVRAEAGRAGGIAKATNSQQMLANRSKAPTYTYTDTDTVTGPVHSTGTGTVTVTVTDTETDTENREGGQGPDLPDAAAAAADAAPPAPASALSPVPAEEDLFSRERLEKIAERNRIPVTVDGVATFYDEMHENGWILYGKRVTRTGITRAFRGWLKYHSEFRLDGVPDEQPAEKRGTDQEGKAQTEEKNTFNSRAELPRKPEKLEPFTIAQREKFLMGYEADSITDAEDEFWDSIYVRLERLFPVAEREKRDPDSVDWDDERTLTEAIKGGYIHAYDFAKDVRRFILTETGVRFYKGE